MLPVPSFGFEVGQQQSGHPGAQVGLDQDHGIGGRRYNAADRGSAKARKPAWKYGDPSNASIVAGSNAISMRSVVTCFTEAITAAALDVTTVLGVMRTHNRCHFTPGASDCVRARVILCQCVAYQQVGPLQT